MPSLADIPSHLFDPRMQIDFLHWLSELPIDEPTARQFMRLWAAQTHISFKADDWDFIARKFRR